MYAIYGDNREFYNGQQRFLLYRFHIADPIHFETKFRMTLDNLGWSGPRYDDYTSCAYWYQTLPSAPLKPLPSDKEMIIDRHRRMGIKHYKKLRCQEKILDPCFFNIIFVG